MDLSSTSNSSIKSELIQTGEVFEACVFHCCVCSDPLNPSPIFQCIHEHHTCSKCHSEGQKQCSVCSLPVTQLCLSLEVDLESLNIPCINKAPENASIFGPCLCPLAGCNFRSDYNDFASHFNTTHLLAIRPFMYGMMYGTVIRLDEETVILKELDDGVIFVMKNKFEKMGNNITLCHFTPITLNMEFSFELTAITPSGESYYLRDAKVQNIQHSASVGPSTVLQIPSDFSQPPGGLTLEIFINRIGAA